MEVVQWMTHLSFECGEGSSDAWNPCKSQADMESSHTSSIWETETGGPLGRLELTDEFWVQGEALPQYVQWEVTHEDAGYQFP